MAGGRVTDTTTVGNIWASPSTPERNSCTGVPTMPMAPNWNNMNINRQENGRMSCDSYLTHGIPHSRENTQTPATRIAMSRLANRAPNGVLTCSVWGSRAPSLTNLLEQNSFPTS